MGEAGSLSRRSLSGGGAKEVVKMGLKRLYNIHIWKRRFNSAGKV